MPKASVIFLSYNQERYVAQSLVSVLDQAYHDYEVIIADDGSTDGTADLIDEILRHHPRAGLARRLERAPNLGITGNWNRAVQLAKGDILIAQGGDDISRLDRVSAMVAQFDSDPSCMAVFSQVDIIDDEGKVTFEAFERGRPKTADYSFDGKIDGFDFWKGAPVLGACGSYRSELARKFSPISKALSEDQPYVYRALLLGRVRFVSETLVQWRWHGLNQSLGGMVDERDSKNALKRRAKMYYDRALAADQHYLDAHQAFNDGLITESRFEEERVRINARKSVEFLGGSCIDPNVSTFTVIAFAADVIRQNSASIRAIRYASTCVLKCLLSNRAKLSLTRTRFSAV
jgi:glycosyltransferase involved in cell wall biosynthesis